MTLLWAFLWMAAGAATPVPTPTPTPPAIVSLLKPVVWKRVIQEREIMTSASLESLKNTGKDAGKKDPETKRYTFYAAMLTRAGLAKTRRILTDYRLYSKMVPYVDKAEFDEKTRILRIEGGIWAFRLASSVRFEERGERWVHYRIVGGHFTGMEGDIFFESQGEKGTVVYFGGEQLGRRWPPAFVIERGAEIVFGFTAKKMRSYIESPESDAPDPEKGPKPDERKKDPDTVPQPRRRLSSSRFGQ